MADTKISALPAAAALAGTEVLPVVQTAATVGATINQVATYVGTTISATELVNAQVGTSYTVVAGDRGKLVTFTNAAAIAVTQPQATGSFAAGWFADYKCLGAGTVTVTPTTSTVNGAATVTLTTGQSARIVSDGTNYQWLVGAGATSGGLTNWTEALRTTTPYSTTFAAASFTATNATATNIDAVFKPKGTGGIIAAIADLSTAGGNQRGTNCVDLQTDRSNSAYVASGTSSGTLSGTDNRSTGIQSVVAGGHINWASGQYSTSSGGNTNTASGTASTIGGGQSNLASSNYTAVGGGFQNNANTSQFAAICGGNTNAASGLSCGVGGGDNNTASGDYSAVPGGLRNTASATASVAMGAYGSSRALIGSVAHGINAGLVTLGVRQSRHVLLTAATTNATTTALTSDAGAAGTANQMCIPTAGSLGFRGMVSFRNTTTGDSGCFPVFAQVKNVAGTVTLSGTPVIGAFMGDSSLSACVVAVVADNTNKGMQITFAGLVATNIAALCEGDTAELN